MFQGKDKIRNILFLFIVLAAATIYYYFYSQTGSSMNFSQESSTLTFSGPKNTSCSFSFDEITSIELAEEPDYGSAVDGGSTTGKNNYGTWESDSLGMYQSFVTTRIKPYIIIRSAEKTAIFNYDNSETTVSLYEQLTEYITPAG